MQHRSQLYSQFTGAVNCHAHLEFFANDTPFPCLPEPAPKRRIKQYYINGFIAYRGCKLLKIYHYRIRGCGYSYAAFYTAHAFESPSRVFKIIIIKILNGLPDAYRFLYAP